MFVELSINNNYLIDENGNVYSRRTNKIMKPYNNRAGKGYLYVCLYNGSKKQGNYAIHRLVAMTFIPNPQNKTHVNHIDGNTLNNNVNNLEWVTPLENVEHAARVIKVMHCYEKANQKRKKRIKQIDIATGKTVRIFDSVNQASRETGIPTSNIVDAAHGVQRYAKGFYWCYVEESI